MHVKVLDYVVYESNGKWHSELIKHPTWAQIEEAIRRLHKFHFPFLFLWPTLDEDMRQLAEGCKWFNVMGEDGEYWIGATIGNVWENNYFNPDGGDNKIRLWTSDQGFATEDKWVCRDIDIVLQSARFYSENGGYDPSIAWSHNINGS